MINHNSLFIIHYSKYILLALVIVLSLFVASSASAGTIIKAPAYLGLNQGLAGCWSLDGLYTKAPDCSGNNNTGTLTNGPTKVQGKVGQALNFDGVNDYVLAAPMSSSVYGANPRTISFWFKADAFDTATGDRMLTLAETGGAGSQFKIYAEDNGISIAFNFVRPNFAANVLSVGRWYHTVIVVPVGATSTSDVLGYIDGVSYPQSGGTPQTLNTTATDNPTFGASDSGGEAFDGLIDEVRIYNRALSITEIQRLYLIGLGSKDNRSIANGGGDALFKGLVGCWSFDGLYTKAPDCSGNNNTGTLTNGPTRVQGKVGQALSFDGVDDSVLGSVNIPLPVTVNAIFKYRVSGDHQVIFANNSGANDGYRVKINTSNQISFTLGGVADYDFTNLTVTENIWYHLSLVVTGNGGTATAYLTPFSGVTSSQALSIGTMSGSLSSFQIGTTTGLGDLFKGTLDEIRVYSRALSVEEVRRLYNQTQSKFNSSQTDSLTYGLVGCWTFNGLYNKAPDCSGNNNTGTLISDPTKAQGKIGQALSFDGASDRVSTTYTTSVPLISMSAWINSMDTGGGFLVSKSTEERFFVEGSNTSVSFGHAFTAGSNEWTTPTGSIQRGRWYHVAVTYDDSSTSNTPRMYIDGVEQVLTQTISTATGSANTSSNPVCLGATCTPTGGYIGKMDEVRIYNRILSPGEVQKLYNMGR